MKNKTKQQRQKTKNKKTQLTYKNKETKGVKSDAHIQNQGVKSTIAITFPSVVVVLCVQTMGFVNHFTNDFSIVMHIRWKFQLPIIQILIKPLSQNFTGGTIFMLIWPDKRSDSFIFGWSCKRRLQLETDFTHLTMIRYMPNHIDEMQFSYIFIQILQHA